MCKILIQTALITIQTFTNNNYAITRTYQPTYVNTHTQNTYAHPTHAHAHMYTFARAPTRAREYMYATVVRCIRETAPLWV